MTTPSSREPAAPPDPPMTATYVMVLAVQAVVLAALWAVQEYFSR